MRLRIAKAEERAYAEILEAIVTQEYAPGDHLTEAALAEKLNISRTPVRSALKKMIVCGMLEYRKNTGYIIPVLTPGDMENVFQARAAIEAKTSCLAAARATEAEVGELFCLIGKEKDFYSKGKISEYTKTNESIHLGIAAMSKNDYLKRFIFQVFWRSELYVVFFDSFYHRNRQQRDPNVSKSCEEHDKLVGAIARRDCKAAAELMKAHIMSTYSSLTGLLPVL